MLIEAVSLVIRIRVYLSPCIIDFTRSYSLLLNTLN